MGVMLRETRVIRELLFPITGEVTVKTFFSYYGIFKGDLMFALYKHGCFYLRITQKAHQHTSWIKELERLEDPRMGIHYKYFYLIPDHILPNVSLYSHLIVETLEEISEKKQKSSSRRKTLIRTLPNLNISIERLLKRLGICSVKELFETGEINVFVELIKRGIDVDKTLLFKLYGAIHHQYIYLMTPSQKLALLKEADEALYAAGLRKRFKVDENTVL